MKILHTSIFAKGFGGGAGRIADEIVEAFASEDYSVGILRPGKRFHIDRSRNNLTELTYSAVIDDYVAVNSVDWLQIRRIFRLLDKFDPDVIHAHHPDAVAMVVQLWALMNNRPFLHTLHVLPTKLLESGMGSYLPKALEHILSPNVTNHYRSFMNNCTAVIALTDSAIADARKAGYSKDIVVIPNGRFLAHYEKSKFADINAKQKTLIFVGHIRQYKNQSYLLDVLKSLDRSYKLILVGEFLNDKDKKSFLKRIQDLGITNRIELAGRVEHREVVKYLEKSHLFVSASLLETMGLVYIEALASGTPVVALENLGSAVLINDSVGRLLPVNTKAEDFAKIVEEICSLPRTKYISMCENSRESVQKYDWENIVKQTANVYEKYLEVSKKNNNSEIFERIRKVIKMIPDKRIRLYLIRKIRTRKKGKIESTLTEERIPKTLAYVLTILSVLSGIVIILLLTKKGIEKVKSSLSK